ncbi:MAG: hypothetical protein DCC49_01465 [Acidobacteria bacterium]|nr:MAG: hypothetical protein DCC49_01465 [Acidobacteriota bacterium]
MRFATAEMIKNKGRFGAIISAIALIVFLVLVLSAIADGLWIGATGALRESGASVFTFSSDGRKSFIRSELREHDVDRVAGVAGVAAAGPVGALLGTARGPHGLLDLGLFGFEPGKPGGPVRIVEGRSIGPGETGKGVADVALRDRGIKMGDRITFTGSDTPVEVIGFAEDSRYQLQPTLWTTMETWRQARQQARPQFGDQTDRLNVIAVATVPGADPATVAAEIDAQLRNTQSLTQIDAILAIPGTEQQRSTFDTLVMATFAVATLVIALFFALLTLEKRELFATTKALGASNGFLILGTATQAVLCSVLGIAGGALLAAAASLALPASVPAVFLASTAITVAAATLLTSLAGAALSFRRLSRIDPATAIGGSG